MEAARFGDAPWAGGSVPFQLPHSGTLRTLSALDSRDSEGPVFHGRKAEGTGLQPSALT